MEKLTVQDLNDAEIARLSRALMKKQARLSLGIAAVFLAIVLGLPLVNRFLPDLANRQVFGFTATWLFLGVLFYPITVALSTLFVRQSDRIEAECADWRTILRDDPGEARR